MQIVIDISEEDFEIIKHNVAVDNPLCPIGQKEMVTKIANGTSLPKGHGELVDRNAINERFYSIYNDAINCSNQPSDKYLLDKLSMCLDTAPTVVEADNEVKK